MLKNKLKVITVLAIIMLLFAIPIVRADNETEDSYKRQDVYLVGEDVVVDYIIDGNLFVIADSLTIDSQIGGDVFVCANEVTVGEQGYVYSNLFAASNIININGIVYDLYGIGKNVNINGYVYRDIRTTSSTININGIIGRNAYINCSDLYLSDKNSSEENEDGENTSLSNKTVISGNLNYSSKKEANIPEGVVSGEVNFEKEETVNENIIGTYIISLGTFVITVIAIWLIGLWLTPKFIKETPSLLTKKKILPVIGLGILTPIVLVILSILLLVLGITSTLGILLLILFFVLIAISTSVFVIAINNIICNKLKITKNITILGILILSAIVLWLIGLIPYVGSIVSFIAVISGLGMITYSILFKNKKKEDKKAKKENKKEVKKENKK